MPTIQNAINTGVNLVSCNFQYSTCVHLTGHRLLRGHWQVNWAGLADVIFVMKHSSLYHKSRGKVNSKQFAAGVDFVIALNHQKKALSMISPATI